MWRLIVACCVLVASGAAAGQCVALTEFAAEPGDIRWRTVNDNVMGGRSRGGYRIEDGALRFRGSTNTNGGGFSSIRSVPKSLALNGDGLALRLRGDGRTYTFRLASYTMRATWWAEFPTKGEWETVFVPFEAFTPRWRGMRLAGPDLRPELVDALGLMIYDKRDGAFALTVDWIAACDTEALALDAPSSGQTTRQRPWPG